MPLVYYKPSALRIIKKFSNEEKAVFNKIINELKESPDAGGFLKGSLNGLRKWKFRVRGIPYRVVYTFEDDRIDIIAVGKRKDFYELL